MAAAALCGVVHPTCGKGDVRLIDLGPAEDIERAVSEYRKAMRGTDEPITRKGEPEAEAELRVPLEALAKPVLRPLEPLLAAFPSWQLSPDAALWLHPGRAAA